MILKNPLFITCCALFWINQGLERLGVIIPWVPSYFDDLLAMPVVFGITLQIMRWLYPLGNQLTFSRTQILVGWGYFSALLELLLPRLSTIYTADFWDIICYGIGSLAFYYWINRPAIRKAQYQSPQAQN